MRKHRIAILIFAVMLTITLAACTGNKPSDTNNTPDSQQADITGNDENTPEIQQTGEFVPDNTIHSVTFEFEDEEHKQAVEEWLKTVLYAEDYYAFIDGEDFDAPYDFDDESPIMAEYFEEGEAHEQE